MEYQLVGRINENKILHDNPAKSSLSYKFGILSLMVTFFSYLTNVNLNSMGNV